MQHLEINMKNMSAYRIEAPTPCYRASSESPPPQNCHLSLLIKLVVLGTFSTNGKQGILKPQEMVLSYLHVHIHINIYIYM